MDPSALAADDPPEPDPSLILEDARRAYDRGDFALVRATVRRILAGSPPAEVRREAEKLLGRTGPDRVSIALALSCLAFFLLVVYSYVIR